MSDPDFVPWAIFRSPSQVRRIQKEQRMQRMQELNQFLQGLAQPPTEQVPTTPETAPGAPSPGTPAPPGPAPTPEPSPAATEDPGLSPLAFIEGTTVIGPHGRPISIDPRKPYANKYQVDLFRNKLEAYSATMAPDEAYKRAAREAWLQTNARFGIALDAEEFMKFGPDPDEMFGAATLEFARQLGKHGNAASALEAMTKEGKWSFTNNEVESLLEVTESLLYSIGAQLFADNPEAQADYNADIASRLGKGEVTAKGGMMYEKTDKSIQQKLGEWGYGPGRWVPDSIQGAARRETETEAIDYEAAKAAERQRRVSIQEKRIAVAGAKEIMRGLRETLAAVPAAEPGMFNRVKGGVQGLVAALSQKGIVGEEAAMYMKKRTAFLAQIARTFGERGMLTEGDIGRINELLPTFFDTQNVRDGLFNDVEDILNEIAFMPPEERGATGKVFTSGKEAESYAKGLTPTAAIKRAAQAHGVTIPEDISPIESDWGKAK